MKLVIDLDYYDKDNNLKKYRVKIEIPQYQKESIKTLVKKMYDFTEINLTTEEE